MVIYVCMEEEAVTLIRNQINAPPEGEQAPLKSPYLFPGLRTASLRTAYFYLYYPS